MPGRVRAIANAAVPIQALFPGKGRQLTRMKSIGTMCSRQMFCQFCRAPVLHFKQQGVCIMARRSSAPASTPGVMVPASAIFATLVRMPELDLSALGFDPRKPQNHPCNAVLLMLLVLPPVSRPAMRTVNLKTGNPFVVEDTIRLFSKGVTPNPGQ